MVLINKNSFVINEVDYKLDFIHINNLIITIKNEN